MDSDSLVILLVEDDQAHAEIVRRCLSGVGLANRIVHVEDGQAALDYLFREGHFADPATSPRAALILLDLRLPKVDGFSVLLRLKEDSTLIRIPTVVLTTSDDEADVVRSYENGAVSYLVKSADCARFTMQMEAFGAYWMTWNRFPN